MSYKCLIRIKCLKIWTHYSDVELENKKSEYSESLDLGPTYQA